MSKEEPIIIDGVDVSRCNHYIEGFYSNCNETNVYAICRNNSNCYFKQLARKTQLSIEQSKELIRLRKELQESTIKNRNLKQECEELKELADANPNSTLRLRNEIRDLQAISVKRKEALEEIKEIAVSTLGHSDWVGQRNREEIEQILLIISKAKGEGNE